MFARSFASFIVIPGRQPVCLARHTYALMMKATFTSKGSERCASCSRYSPAWNRCCFVHGRVVPAHAFDSDNNGPYATAAGWGLTVNGDWTSGADILQHVEIPVRFDATCGTYWNSRFFNANVNVCAAGAGTTVDTCQGDSGGPLFVDDPHFSGDPADVPKLVGLVSLGAGCGLTYPSVFVEVAAYRDWICRNTEEMIAQHSLPAAAKVQGCA